MFVGADIGRPFTDVAAHDYGVVFHLADGRRALDLAGAGQLRTRISEDGNEA